MAESVSDSGKDSNLNVSNSYNDPYYISNSDQTVNKLVAINLNSTNSVSWKRNVKRALVAKNKIGFLDGSIEQPDVNDKDFNSWLRCDYLVTCWIVNSMEPEIGENFTFVESSAQLWNEVCERFGQSNGPQIYQIKKALENLKQENLSIVNYYSKMKRFWDELHNLRNFPDCSCGAVAKCSCNFLKKLAAFQAEEQLMEFLLGLNERFDNVISNILSMDPLPSINRAYYIAQQIETQKEISAFQHSTSETSALIAQRFQSGKRDWKKEKLEKMNL